MTDSIAQRQARTVYVVLVSISAGHFINDLAQAILPPSTRCSRRPSR
jgi:hypothetical protein